jgi:Co/Zn/Cd efflux system component
MKKSVFYLQKMDCPTEEQLVRMKLSEFKGVKKMSFDLNERQVTIHHLGELKPLKRALDELQLKSKLVSSKSEKLKDAQAADELQRTVLIQVLLINALFFGVEIITGFLSNSMGLVADSLDMLADAIVYSLSLFAVGSTIVRKKKVTKLIGYFQLALVVFGFTEVIRRFLSFSGVPDVRTMIMVSLFALSGNVLSSILLQRSKSDDSHIKASIICTSNDVIANIGVIFAGVLVMLTASPLPDLIVGSLIFLIVARGAYKILKLAK